MDSLPSVQSLHLALTSEDAAEAEEELLSVISHLLVCAIEDPGIPNPVRHTTLLGQSLRTADITNSNISEILRIYLYAVATGEVRTLNGITLDRERERRVADHHQLDPEQLLSTGRNREYYECLQQNRTWKLSECLKDKPFVALNPTVKAEILAHLCNDLLLNKAVVRQIENSLDAVAQHKRERYAIENRVRKYKHMHARKVRMEQFEKQQQLAKQIAAQQAAALAQAQAEAQAALAAACAEAIEKKTNGDDDKNADGEEATEINDGNKDESVRNTTETKVSDQEDSPSKSQSTNDLSKIEATPTKNDESVNISTVETPTTKPLNNGLTTPDHHKKNTSKDADLSTVDGENDDISDIESEGTILEDDEDNRMTADEIHKKLEKILKSQNQNKQLIEQNANSLRANCYGQDRFWRRYWHLPKAGGIFVEGLESAQAEILKYHVKLEELHKQVLAAAAAEENADRKRRGKKRKLTLVDEPTDDKNGTDENKSTEEIDDMIDDETNEIESEKEEECMEVAEEENTKEMNGEIISDDEPEEKENEIEEEEDIEDSIPKAILLQKTPEKEANTNDKDTKTSENAINQNHCDAIPENDDESKKLEDESNCDNDKSKLENGNESNNEVVAVKQENESIETLNNCEAKITAIVEPKSVINIETNAMTGEAIKIEIKNEVTDEIIEEPILEKWFSIANREIQLTSCETQIPFSSQAAYSNITCDMILQCQGNRWDIANNANYFHIPVEAPTNLQINRTSILSISGLDEEMCDKVMNGILPMPDKPAINESPEVPVKTENNDVTDLEMDDEQKNQMILVKAEPETQPFQLPSFLNMSFANISAFVQCDNQIPVQMTPEEHTMLEEVKRSGMPKRVESNFVPKELCHGWWKLNDIDTLNDLIQTLHVKGVRERELRMNLLQALSENIDLSTPCPIANLRSPPPAKGYNDPEPMNAWNPSIARRVELALLDQVESLEDKIAGASMQIKGWTAPTREPEVENELDLVTGINMIRERILGLEAAIERRYLKPPLGTSTAESTIAAITTQSVTLSSTREITTTITTTQPAPQNDDQNSSAGSVATTPEREVLPKGKF